MREHLGLGEKGRVRRRRVYGHLADVSVVDFEAGIIKEMCQRILDGEGFNEARNLNRHGVATLEGNLWRASSIVGIPGRASTNGRSSRQRHLRGPMKCQ